jgi:hypothetical protein
MTINTDLSRLWYKVLFGSKTDVITEFPYIFNTMQNKLSDWELFGNVEVSGTPTSDNPIMPQGTGKRTANLFDKSKRTDNSRVVYTTGEIGTLSGVFVSDFTPIEPNTTYTLNIVSSISGKTGHLFALYDENKNFVNTGAHEATPATVYTFTTPSNVAYIRFNGNMASADEIMLNSGSTALPYEPNGIKIPISSAYTTTPIYLGEVETTRKVKKLVLTGEEEWTLQSINSYGIANLWTRLSVDYSNRQLGLSSHLSVQTTMIANTQTEGFYLTSSDVIYIRISATRASTAADFKSYLQQQYAAGTPVCVWYVLAEPETAVVNEPLMKIGEYADSLSRAKTGIDIPTVVGQNTLDVLTTVKPSSMRIEYTSADETKSRSKRISLLKKPLVKSIKQ